MSKGQHPPYPGMHATEEVRKYYFDSMGPYFSEGTTIAENQFIFKLTPTARDNLEAMSEDNRLDFIKALGEAMASGFRYGVESVEDTMPKTIIVPEPRSEIQIDPRF